ncbi:uncharacterized protein Z519_06761 [Cladophialophora bantiana CBS 173.52]|uniref:DUF7066 domain-containing protein n=1 Tax=Cladophialophora bantiana (strain ATCC 10958 / CBS 173.52 / CDC B-1940 / NIH 8579) TaxID=1442370 RepID=A0A0D2G2G8_CLAB1|nr:uncharacterized protein Z519_06761 [Cladophialophora bantiana CBS 173.52]KIW92912.1 hypothetical protein Z519_06761 [Cladophialophora bantiana CBS 173.52]
MAAARISNTSSIWDFKDTLFRALAAACAAMGEEPFRRQLKTIATYYGEGATYHEIETLFTKDIPAKAEELKLEFAHRHDCGRQRPSRGIAGSRRPPLLDFDDEGLSILSPGEVEILKARSNNSLRAPAKRRRVIEASPRTPPAGDAPASKPMAPHLREPGNGRVTTTRTAANDLGVALCVSSHIAGQNHADCLTRETITQTRKRTSSEFHDPIELPTASNPHLSAPPRFESFGYVTKNGEYRCALCQRQLPDEGDLKLHEQISKDHIRSLKDKQKVIQGRERLAKLTAARTEGHPTGPSTQCCRLSINDLLASSPRPPAAVRSGLEESDNSFEYEVSVRQNHDRQDSPMDVDETRRHDPSALPIRQSVDHAASMSPARPLQISDKGKDRAASLMSLSDDSTPRPNALPALASEIYTRSMTAQTEIGTLDTPHPAQYIGSAPTKPSHSLEAKPADGAPEISASTINEILRSTGVAIDVLHAFRNSASAWVESNNTTFESGSATIPESKSEALFKEDSAGPTDNSALPTTVLLETLDDAGPPRGSNPNSRTDEQGTISGPGIKVRLGVRREDVNGCGKKKDVGEPISVIVLD